APGFVDGGYPAFPTMEKLFAPPGPECRANEETSLRPADVRVGIPPTAESPLRRTHSTQSARKTFVSPSCAAPRLDAKTSMLPSGLNIGKPSKSGFVVTRSSPVPSTLIRYRSKSRPDGSCMFELKMIWRPFGCGNGAKFAAPLAVRRRWFVPSAFMM